MKRLFLIAVLFATVAMAANNSLQYQVIMNVNGIAKTFYMSDTITNYNVNEGQITSTFSIPFGFVYNPKHIYIYNRDSTITARLFTKTATGVYDTISFNILPKQQLLLDLTTGADSLMSAQLVYSKKTYVYTYVGK